MYINTIPYLSVFIEFVKKNNNDVKNGQQDHWGYVCAS